MSDDRCGAVHPTLGVRCDRIKKHCYIDHTATLKSGLGIFWPNPDGSTPMYEYFREWLALRRATVGLEEYPPQDDHE